MDVNAISVGEIVAIFVVLGVISRFVMPFILKWLKIDDNATKLKGLPELIATQQRQIDDINNRLTDGNKRFSLIEKDLKIVQEELENNHTLFKSMDIKLDILVSAQLGIHQPHDLEMLKENYIQKKKEQLKG